MRVVLTNQKRGNILNANHIDYLILYISTILILNSCMQASDVVLKDLMTNAGPVKCQAMA